MKIITMKSSATAALATLALALVPASLQAREITVPSGQIRTIQQGVDAAAPGDTVLVRPGTYVINNNGGGWPAGVEIGPDKPGLKLRAGGPPGSVKIVGVGTISPGPLNWRGISVGADNVLVEGFDISGLFQTGIQSGASVPPGTRITGNTIHDLQSSFSSIAIGITPGPSNEVDHNTIYGCVWGIMLGGWSAAGPNWQAHIHHNQVSNQVNVPSMEAGGRGIFLWQAPGCRLDHNQCNNNGQLGIYLASSPSCTTDHNQADQNGESGIVMGESPDCKVSYNDTDNNGWWGIIVGSSCGSAFDHNSAEGNGQYDLFAHNWESPPTCNTYQENRAGTAWPSLALWDVK